MKKKKFKLEKNSKGYYSVGNPPKAHELSEYYSKKYFKINPRYAKKTKYFEEEYYKNQSLIRFFFIKKYLKVKHPSLLDLGAGTGRFIHYVSKYCKKVVGVDFSNSQLKYKLSKNTSFLADEPVNFINQKKLEFNIITLNNVIEHALKPKKILLNLKQKIKKNTFVLVSIPNDFSTHQKFLIKKKLVSKKYWLSFPDHLNYFDSKSFHKYIESLGYTVVDEITDFPVELFLFEKSFNYVDKDMGKNVHQLRCNFVNYLCQNNDIYKVIDFFKSINKIGIGRNNYYLLKKK